MGDAATIDTASATATAAPDPASDEKITLRALLQSGAVWRWLFGLARPYRARLAVAGVSLLLSTAVGLVLPAAAGRVVDVALVEKSLGDLRTVILAIIGLFALNGLFAFVEVYALRTTAALVLQTLRTRLHAHLTGLTPGFYETQRTGDLLSRLGSDVDQIAGALTNELIYALDRAVSLVGALVILFAVHTGLTLIMLLAVPPVIVAAVLFGLRFERLSKERQDAFAAAGVVAEESLSGIRTVQAFAREPLERARYGEKIGRATDLAFRTARAWGAFSGVVSFMAMSAVALVLWYGGTLVVEGALTAGALTSFLLYTLGVASSVGTLTGVYASLRTALGATTRVRELLETRPLVEDPADAVPLGSAGGGAPGRARGEVELRDVGFAYASAGGRAAIEGVSLRAAPGEVTALVGPSGAGKSTLVALLLRFYDPARGAVLLDGTDVRRLRAADLRGAIGLVPQDIFLFGGTVAENIRYGRADASDDDVARAAEAAHARGFIERLPKGFATEVGERGVKLSTGERQRIAIARVFLKDPPVVVLDEATSSLDAESEHAIQQALERLMSGRTTIVIAHRLATVRRARQVVLLEAGRISDRGTHEELYARSPMYKRLCDLQFLGAAPAEPATAVAATY
jgi:ABC-type multidrug transport system fused ATPase/permease subunit